MVRQEKIDLLLKYYEEFKTIEFKKRDQSKFINIEPYEIVLNNGKTILREKIIKNDSDGNAVIIVAITRNREIVSVIEPRVFTKDTVVLGFPAGYIEKGEEPIKAALRELVEETGYIPEDIIEIDSFYQDEGCSSAYNHIFVAFGCEKKEEQKLDESEYVRELLLNLEELLEFEKRKYLVGANSKLALTKAIPYIKRRKI